MCALVRQNSCELYVEHARKHEWTPHMHGKIIADQERAGEADSFGLNMCQNMCWMISNLKFTGIHSSVFFFFFLEPVSHTGWLLMLNSRSLLPSPANSLLSSWDQLHSIAWLMKVLLADKQALGCLLMCWHDLQLMWVRTWMVAVSEITFPPCMVPLDKHKPMATWIYTVDVLAWPDGSCHIYIWTLFSGSAG